MCNGFAIFWKQTQDFKVLKDVIWFFLLKVWSEYVNIFSIGSFLISFSFCHCIVLWVFWRCAILIIVIDQLTNC